VFRRLALDYLPGEVRDGLGIRSIEERKVEAAEKIGEQTSAPAAPAPAPAPSAGQPPSAPAPAAKPIELLDAQTAKALDAPLCYSCGSKMQPAGSCYVCSTCGSTSGCS
jgi:ribonucleoside-diphosphate reductase alpha chain